MKILIALTFFSIGAQAFACSCMRTFTTPYPHQIAHEKVESMGLKAAGSEIVKYVPTLIDRLSSIGQEPTGGNCIGRLLGKPIHSCTESFRGNIKVNVENSDCHVLVKVVRKKHSYSSKVLKSTCL